jgi:hypothetical protein
MYLIQRHIMIAEGITLKMVNFWFDQWQRGLSMTKNAQKKCRI